MAEINLDINANITDAIKGIDKTQQSLESLDGSYKEMGDTSQKAFSAANDEIKTQNDLIGDTEKELKDLERQIKRTQDPDKLKKYNRQLDEGKKKLQEYKTKGVPAIKKVNKEASTSEKIFGKLKGVIAGAFAVGTVVNFVKQIVNVRKEFEKFEAVLTNTLGSQSAAQAALSQIQQFAAETPFSVQQLTGSFVKLANQGFIPTQKEMRRLGDLAASTGKDFDQLTEALIDAQVGEFERLKEFGVRAQKEGDKVTFTFKGVKKQVDFTNDSIREYVLGLGDAEGVSGSMAAISETLGGRISNMGDSWDRFLNTLGSTGPFATIAQTSLKLITESLNTMAETLESEVLTNWEKFFVFLKPEMIGLAKQLTDAENKFKSMAIEVANISDEAQRKQGLIDALGKLREEWGENEDAVNKLRDAFEKAFVQQRVLNKTIEDNSKAAQDNTDETGKQLTAYEALKKEIVELNKQLLNETTLQDDNAASTARLIAIKEERLKQIDDEVKFLKEAVDTQGRLAKFEETTVKLADKTAKTLKETPDKGSFFDSLFGNKDQQQEALSLIKDLGAQALDAVQQQQEMRIAMIDRQIEAQNHLIAETQRQIQIEGELKAKGFANDVQLEKDKLKSLQETRNEALKEQAKVVRQQQQLATLETAASLGVAVANIVKTSSKLGPAAPVVAGLAIAALFALFAASKSQASNLSKFKKGGFGIVDGPSHESGGVYIPGVGEVEGKEAFSVFNKKATKRHGKLIEGITSAINKDNIPAINMMLNNELREKEGSVKVSLDDSKYMRENNQLMRQFVNSPYIDSKGRKIIRKGSLTRIYK